MRRTIDLAEDLLAKDAPAHRAARTHRIALYEKGVALFFLRVLRGLFQAPCDQGDHVGFVARDNLDAADVRVENGRMDVALPRDRFRISEPFGDGGAGANAIPLRPGSSPAFGGLVAQPPG